MASDKIYTLGPIYWCGKNWVLPFVRRPQIDSAEVAYLYFRIWCLLSQYICNCIKTKLQLPFCDRLSVAMPTADYLHGPTKHWTQMICTGWRHFLCSCSRFYHVFGAKSRLLLMTTHLSDVVRPLTALSPSTSNFWVTLDKLPNRPIRYTASSSVPE